MGQESPIQLGQRRQDARQEVPMRTPKQLYAEERIMYRGTRTIDAESPDFMRM